MSRKRDEFDDLQYELSVQCGMNQRYHQNRETLFARWDRWIRIVVGISAVVGFMLSMVTLYESSSIWLGLGILIAALSAVSAVVLNVVPVGSWEKEHADLHRRWCDLREEIDALDGAPLVPETHARMETLRRRIHRVCAIEKEPNMKLLEKCQLAEEKSRQYWEPTAA